MTTDALRAQIEALVPFTWTHSTRCARGDHSCFEPDDNNDEVPYEAPDCTRRRENAEKAYRRQVDALLSLLTPQASAAHTPTIGAKIRDAIEADVLRRVAKRLDRRLHVTAAAWLRAEADRIEEGAR